MYKGRSNLTTGKYSTREDLIDAICIKFHANLVGVATIGKSCGVSQGTASLIIDKHYKDWKRLNNK